MNKIEISNELCLLLLKSIELLPHEDKNTKIYKDLHVDLLKIRSYWDRSLRAAAVSGALTERKRKDNTILAATQIKSQEKQGIRNNKKYK